VKTKIFQAAIIGLMAALGLYFRPQIAEALSLSVVGWGETNSVTTDMVVDGSVTDAKIANNASETNRIQSWASGTVYNIDASSGISGSLTVDPSISVTVPSGKAYYYLLKYEGSFYYSYDQRRSGEDRFKADLQVTPLSGTTPIGDSTLTVKTGARVDWSALGLNSYWASPSQATWVVRLTEGTHNLKFKNDLNTDGTMDWGHIEHQRVQVMRIP